MSTILAVDDSHTMRKCLEITFSGTEFNLVAVNSAQEALEKVKTLSPDLVIADVSLPPNDGYELCSTIKLAAPGIPVLMLSSKQNPFDPAKGSQADDHIDKPFDSQVLQDRARGLVQPTEQSDTDVPGAIPGRKVSPTMPERGAPASSKIPAPRRKRPTPAMMTNPLKQAPAAQAAASPAAAARRTVPFAMPGSAKRTVMGQGAPSPETVRKGGAGATQPIGQKDLEASQRLSPAATQAKGGYRKVAAAQPEPAQQAQHVTPTPQPAGDTLRGVPGADGAVQLPPDAAADLQTKLNGLGLTKAQIEGVLSLSRELIEQVVWDVVPTLAETLIKEEIARLTEG